MNPEVDETIRDELEHALARERSLASHYRRRFEKFYNRTRTLETAIKKHARHECDCKGTGECLTRLVALTPVNDRPTLREARMRS